MDLAGHVHPIDDLVRLGHVVPQFADLLDDEVAEILHIAAWTGDVAVPVAANGGEIGVQGRVLLVVLGAPWRALAITVSVGDTDAARRAAWSCRCRRRRWCGGRRSSRCWSCGCGCGGCGLGLQALGSGLCFSSSGHLVGKRGGTGRAEGRRRICQITRSLRYHATMVVAAKCFVNPPEDQLGLSHR